MGKVEEFGTRVSRILGYKGDFTDDKVLSVANEVMGRWKGEGVPGFEDKEFGVLVVETALDMGYDFCRIHVCSCGCEYKRIVRFGQTFKLSGELTEFCPECNAKPFMSSSQKML